MPKITTKKFGVLGRLLQKSNPGQPDLINPAAVAKLKELLRTGQWYVATSIERAMWTAHFTKKDMVAAREQLGVIMAQPDRPRMPVPSPAHPYAHGMHAIVRRAWVEGRSLWRLPIPLHVCQPYADPQCNAPGRDD